MASEPLKLTVLILIATLNAHMAQAIKLRDLGLEDVVSLEEAVISANPSCAVRPGLVVEDEKVD